MAGQNDQEEKQYVFPYDPSGMSLWVWAIILGLLFLLFVVGIYYASRGPAPGPAVSARQTQLTGGFMGTPGAF